MPRLCARKNGRQTPADPAHWQSLPRRNRFGCRQSVSGVLFFGRHFPLVLGDELAVSVVVETGKGKRIGKGRLKVILDDLDISLGFDPTYVGIGGFMRAKIC